MKPLPSASLLRILRRGAPWLAAWAGLAANAPAQMIPTLEGLVPVNRPATREAAPEDPSLEPVVSLSTLVLALSEALNSEALTLAPETALALELQLAALIDEPVLARADAVRHEGWLTATLASRHLMIVADIARWRNFAARPDLLGANGATANPFYNPGSIPGYAARFVLARLDARLRPEE